MYPDEENEMTGMPMTPQDNSNLFFNQAHVVLRDQEFHQYSQSTTFNQNRNSNGGGQHLQQNQYIDFYSNNNNTGAFDQETLIVRDEEGEY